MELEHTTIEVIARRLVALEEERRTPFLVAKAAEAFGIARGALLDEIHRAEESAASDALV